MAEKMKGVAGKPEGKKMDPAARKAQGRKMYVRARLGELGVEIKRLTDERKKFQSEKAGGAGVEGPENKTKRDRQNYLNHHVKALLAERKALQAERELKKKEGAAASAQGSD